MQQMSDTKLTRIGVFYDGNYFLHVSNYYLYSHSRRARISIKGLHDFIRQEVAEKEQMDARYCQIVDAHYFRGRLSAADAQERDKLYGERVFEDVLISEGVTTHFLPLSPQGEKGIDVWLALEAFELAIYKRFNVSVLVTGDGDYVPLVRKLNTIGTRVMLMAWDFRFTDKDGREKETRTSQALINEVTYPVMMGDRIDDRSHKNDTLVDNLFFIPKPSPNPRGALPIQSQVESNLLQGTISNIREGFGFITPDSGGENLFFHRTSVENCDFNDLRQGDQVQFTLGKNDQGPCAVQVKRVV
jgi:cold shock CspA family protein/uncharacterized LabA/DUF88 family protein